VENLRWLPPRWIDHSLPFFHTIGGNTKDKPFERTWKENNAFLGLGHRGNFHEGYKIHVNRNLCGGYLTRAYFYGSDIHGEDHARKKSRHQRQRTGPRAW